MQRSFRRSLRATVNILAALAIAGCADRATGPTGPQGEFVFRASVIGTTIATMVVEVTAPDITSPLAFNIPIAGGVASGTVRLPPGEDRTITLKAFDNLQNQTHEGSKTISVKPGQNPPVSIPVVSRAGQVTINAVMGPVGVSVTPSSANINVGATTQLTVTITGPNGDVLAGPASFATLNPSIASVSAVGLVTGIGEGNVQIVATYAGVGAAASITVGPQTAPALRVAVGGQANLTIHDGNTLAVIGTYPLGAPGYSADFENGIVYVGSFDKIYAVTAATGLMTTLGIGHVTGNLYGLVARNGTLYVSGSGMAEVRTLTTSGAPAPPIFSTLGFNLRSVAFGPDGSFYLTAGNGVLVQRWAADFSSNTAFAPGPLMSPYGIDTRANGEVLVAALNQAMYVVYSPSGAFLRSVPVNCTGQLRDLAVDDNGNVWIACTFENTVVKFNSQDQEVARINNLDQPSGIAVY